MRARANKSMFSRYKDPCQRKHLKDGLPEGPVDVPNAYDEVESVWTSGVPPRH